MTWECQGLLQHEWFGTGTFGDGDGDADTANQAVAVQVAYAALPHLAPDERRPYEAWLDRSGVDTLASVLPAWERGASLGAETFRTRFFGQHGQHQVATLARDVDTLLARAPEGPGGDALRLDAGRSFAELVQTARGEALPPVMAVAARQAKEAPQPLAPARPAAPPVPRNETPQQRRARILREQNIRNMATVMWQEARQQGALAMTAVGFTLRNRLARSSEVAIADIWRGYNHHAVPGGLRPPDAAAWVVAQRIARDIVEDKHTDPTQGATHFYSPNAMPVDIQPTTGTDTAGGLEDVPGTIYDPDGQHHLTYRPGYASVFPQIAVPGIPEADFKFFRAPDGIRFGRRRANVGSR